MSVFNCNIKYTVVPGNTYQTTYNKLLSQGFIDKYLNVKVDVGKWRKGRSEINQEASLLLRRDVNLFGEKKLLNGIRAVPDMKEFGIIDMYHREARENARKTMLNESAKRQQLERENYLTEEIDYGDKDVVDEIYEQLEMSPGSLISAEQIKDVTPILARRSEQGKVLSLREVVPGKFVINVDYTASYLYRDNNNAPLEDKTEMFKETDSNNNFNLPCIQ